MTQSELEQAAKNGQIEQPKTEQNNPAQDNSLFNPQVDMTAYMPLLASLLSPRKYLAAAPTFVPKNFLEQIQIVDDGTGVYLYIYFTDSGWQYSKLSETNSNKLKIVASPITIQNTTTETDIFSFTLPANTLSINNAIKSRTLGGASTTITFNNGSDTLTIQGYYGGSSFSFPLVITGSNTGAYAIEIEFWLIASGATNSQVGIMKAHLWDQTAGFANNVRQTLPIAYQTFSIDSTAAQTMKLTAKWSAASNNDRFIVDSSIVDLVK